MTTTTSATVENNYVKFSQNLSLKIRSECSSEGLFIP